MLWISCRPMDGCARWAIRTPGYIEIRCRGSGIDRWVPRPGRACTPYEKSLREPPRHAFAGLRRPRFRGLTLNRFWGASRPARSRRGGERFEAIVHCIDAVEIRAAHEVQGMRFLPQTGWDIRCGVSGRTRCAGRRRGDSCPADRRHSASQASRVNAIAGWPSRRRRRRPRRPGEHENSFA